MRRDFLTAEGRKRKESHTRKKQIRARIQDRASLLRLAARRQTPRFLTLCCARGQNYTREQTRVRAQEKGAMRRPGTVINHKLHELVAAEDKLARGVMSYAAGNNIIIGLPGRAELLATFRFQASCARWMCARAYRICSRGMVDLRPALFASRSLSQVDFNIEASSAARAALILPSAGKVHNFRAADRAWACALLRLGATWLVSDRLVDHSRYDRDRLNLFRSRVYFFVIYGWESEFWFSIKLLCFCGKRARYSLSNADSATDVQGEICRRKIWIWPRE